MNHKSGKTIRNVAAVSLALSCALFLNGCGLIHTAAEWKRAAQKTETGKTEKSAKDRKPEEKSEKDKKKQKENNGEKKASIDLSQYDFPEEIREYDDGDYIYTPSSEHLALDDDGTSVYFDDLISVDLERELTDEEADALAASVGGEVVSKISGIVNSLQIRVSAAEKEELESISEKLRQAEVVLYAGLAYPVRVDMEERNDWGGDKDLGQETSPAGHDWWAEAIGAYTAWDIMDGIEKKPVTVSVIDNGFYENHEDFLDADGKSVLKVLNQNTWDTPHGTKVAGIVAAQDNSIGIRGIADYARFTAYDWKDGAAQTSVWTNQDSFHKAYLDVFNEVIAYGKENPEWKKTPIVINISFGFDNKNDGAGETIDTARKEGAAKMMRAMDILLDQSPMDFLIVQSAGNQNVNTAHNGYCCSFNEDSYQLYLDDHTEKTKVHSLEEFKDHTIIVSGVNIPNGPSDPWGKKLGNQYQQIFDFGNNVDIVAPAVNVYTTTHPVLESGGEMYTDGTGTSVAAPIVAGAAALLWQITPELSAGEVKDILIETAGTAYPWSGSDTRKEYPMLDLAEAVRVTAEEYGQAVEKSDILTEPVPGTEGQTSASGFTVTPAYPYPEGPYAAKARSGFDGIMKITLYVPKGTTEADKAQMEQAILAIDGMDKWVLDLTIVSMTKKMKKQIESGKVVYFEDVAESWGSVIRAVTGGELYWAPSFDDIIAPI